MIVELNFKKTAKRPVMQSLLPASEEERMLEEKPNSP